MKSILIRKTARKPFSLQSLRRDLLNLLNLLSLEDVEISIYLVGNRRMRYLNRLYRGIDKPTDVLSFPQIEATGSAIRPPVSESIPSFSVLGDIVLNLDQIKKQAAENRVSFKDELRFMLIHGLLHLLGYDHERDKRSARIMRKKEKSLLNALKKLDQERK
ncbi:MAG: rRNA maturation RNase YbeY [Thermodesulfovibrionales bacterium]|nr:rRNA maturation RNase YbeY [Thermodesulfovibrionales bacterium]